MRGKEAVCIVILLLMASCAAPEPAEPDVYPVAQGTQLNLGDLRIGIISVSTEQAMLTVRIETLNLTQRIVIGTDEEKEVGAYHIRNLGTKKYFLGGLKPGSPSGSVRLQVKEAKKIEIPAATIKILARDENDTEIHIADVFVKEGEIEMASQGKLPEETEKLAAALKELGNTTVFTTIDTFEIMDGKRVLAMKKYPVSPHSPEYIYAIGDTLSLEYGFIVDYPE